MSSPIAHSILWAAWQAGEGFDVFQLFAEWSAGGADPDDLAGAADLLLMDAEWRRASGESVLLEILEKANPNPHIQGTISKCARGFVLDEAVATHVWDQEKIARNRPELAKYMGHFPELEKWSQPGSGNHWQKLGSLVEYVDAGADLVTSSGMPLSLVFHIERFAEGARRWLKIAGGGKAELLRDAVLGRKHGWRPWETILECGAFVGYSSIRLASALQEASCGSARVISVEVDPVQACIARHFVDLAGCSNAVEVWVGQFRDVLGRTVEEFGRRALGLVFLDYKGTSFHVELAKLERLAAPAPHCQAVADNVVLPGAPLYLWEMTRHQAWATIVWALPEFLEPNVEDWMCVSAYLSPTLERPPPAPPEWVALSWHTDHMRRRAQGMRPGESHMTEDDRVGYARRVRALYQTVGVKAIPWASGGAQRSRFESRR